jgi:hypothetical protein
MLDDPQQNFRKKMQLKSSVMDSDSDGDIVVHLGSTVGSTSHS